MTYKVGDYVQATQRIKSHNWQVIDRGTRGHIKAIHHGGWTITVECSDGTTFDCGGGQITRLLRRSEVAR